MIARAAVAFVALAAGGGCAQILGLDDTQRRDASGPGVCDQPIDCSSATMRAICGQLVDAVTEQPFQRIGATGALCLPTDTDGPCGFAIAGVAAASDDELFSTFDTSTPATVLDDCGRFKIEGLTGPKLAVVATPVPPADATFRKVIRVILYNTLEPQVTAIDVVVVADSLVTTWDTQSGQTTTDALLVKFRAGQQRIAGVQATIGSVAVPLPPAVPYSLYFGGPNQFESLIDPTSGALQTDSGTSGTGLVVPVDGSPITLSGLRTAGGGTCNGISGVRRTPGALVWIDLTDC